MSVICLKFKKLVVYDFEESTLRDKLKPFCEKMVIVKADSDFTNTLTKNHLIDADGCVVKPFENFNSEFFSLANKLKYFGITSTGYDSVDTTVLKKNKVTFTNVPDFSTEAVAEVTISALLEIARHFSQEINAIRPRSLHKDEVGFELKGKTIGIIGLGNIGFRVAELCKAFGMNILYTSKVRKKDKEKELGAKFVQLDDLLKQSDIVSVNCALNKDTFNLLSKKKMGLLKKGTIVLNSARGEVCDLVAAKEFAKKGQLFFWFDAFDKKENRDIVIDTENIFTTPHIGWLTQEAQENLDRIAVENVKKYLERKPINVIK